MDACKNKQTDDYLDAWDEWTGGYNNIDQLDGWLDKWMINQMDGPMNERKNG